MGKEKTTVVSQGSTTQQYTPTTEETKLNQLLLGQAQAADPYQRQLQQAGLQTGTQLLSGQPLPGYLGTLPGGITNEDVSASINEGLRHLNPWFQQGGLLNSGVAADISSRFAGEQKLAQKQFNLQNLMQLLNIGVGGQAVPQQSILAGQGQLSSNLAGLRSGTTSYLGNQATYGMNPFVKSFQQGAGTSLGKGIFFG